MNPLRFRSLRRERNTNTLLRQAAALTAVAALGIFAQPLARAAEDFPHGLPDQLVCKYANTNDARTIYADDHGNLKAAYDPAHNCDKNAGNETISFNALAVERTRDLAKLRNQFAAENHSHVFLSNVGACRLAYEGVQNVYETFSHLRENYCDHTNSLLQIAKDCGAPNDKNCESDWKEWGKAQKQYTRELTEKHQLAIKYLNALGRTVSTAKEKYQADLDKLEPVFSRQEASAKTSPTDSLPDAPEVKAANGNQGTQRSNLLQDYYSLLRRVEIIPAASVRNPSKITHTSGPLIAEEEVANKTLQTYRDSLKKEVDDEFAKASYAEKWAGELIGKNDRNSFLGDSNLNKAARVSPDLITGASAAQKLMSGSGAAAAITSGAAHAPLAEVAAVAGLGALVAKSFGSAPSGSGASAPATPGAPSEGKADKPVAADLGNNAPDTPTSGNGKTIANNPGTATPGPNAKLDAAGTVPAGGFTSSNLVGGEGSSRMLAGRRATAPASATAEAGGSAPPIADLGSSFKQNLEPKPSPRGAVQSPGSEVANLLGQMKNLFNFDDPPPSGGPGGAPMPGGGPADIGSGGGAPMPGGGAEIPAGGPDASADTVADAGGAPTTGAAIPGEAHSSLFGRLDTSLFQRVRARHQHCIERGLVRFGPKERVE